jgi:hypothetical protein
MHGVYAIANISARSGSSIVRTVQIIPRPTLEYNFGARNITDSKNWGMNP